MDDAAIRNRWIRFFDMDSDVRTLYQVHYKPGLGPRPWPYAENEDQRVTWALEYYESMLRAREVVADDRIPFLAPYTGTEIFAQAFGCGVYCSGDNMPFALPRIHSASQVKSLRIPSVFAPPLERVFRIARRLRDRYPDALMQLPDIQSPFDIAALIWEKGEFYAACLDEPEAVLELCHKVEALLTGFLDEWFRLFGTDYIAHYPEYFVRGGMTLSEDEAGAISPRMFETFCLPPLQRLNERYGGLCIHCCANSEPQWDNFARIPGLRLLNLNQPGPVMKRAFKRFAPVVAQMHDWIGEGEPGPAWREYMPDEAHIVLYTSARTDDEARRALERLRSVREG